jgi:hypothetical protein
VKGRALYDLITYTDDGKSKFVRNVGSLNESSSVYGIVPIPVAALSNGKA